MKNKKKDDLLERISIKLEKIPEGKDFYVWGDYIELLCLVNVDHEVSKAYILDRLFEREDLGESHIEEEEEEDVAVYRDKNELFIDDCFRYLASRLAMVENSYPFQLTPDGDTIIRIPSLTRKHYLYLFFLYAANLRYTAPKALTNILTSKFEHLSASALRSSLPDHAEVHVFGTSAEQNGHFTGSLWNKIQTLAEDLGESPRVTQASFSRHNSGDNGLDIVAWIPLGDRVPGLFVVFGQCACTLDWVTKQFSSSAQRWRSYIPITAEPYNVAFIPHYFRDSAGVWYAEHEIAGTVLIDRMRFIHALKSNPAILDQLGIVPFIEQLIAQREALV